MSGPAQRDGRPGGGTAVGDLAGERSIGADATALVAQLGRRAEAASRLPPLQCGCADPSIHRCNGSEPDDDLALDAWCATAEALLRLGTPPLVPRSVLRALWRRGGDDAALAQQLEQFARCPQ